MYGGPPDIRPEASQYALVILGEEAGEKPRYGSRGNTKEIAEKPALEPVAMAGEIMAEKMIKS